MKTKLFIKDQKGAALVEFAIVLPLLALLAGGVVEFGLILYNQQVLTNASREGARIGIYTRCDSDGTNYNNAQAELIIDTVVQTYCSQHLVTFGSSSLPIPIFTGVRGAFQADLSVEVNYNYNFLLPSLRFWNVKNIKG